MPVVHIPGLKCNVCGHTWQPRADNPQPVRCPNPKCRSAYWDRERRIPASAVQQKEAK